MILNDRKIKILEAIINDYIATAEPIGSRTIAKKYNLGISSATIRNEMSDLEELGFIVQPHTSSGRIPSVKGYRLYVDRLMHSRELTSEETILFQNIISSNINHIDYLMQQTAKALAMLTNYTTIVSEPKSKCSKIKHIQLVPLDESSIIAVIVNENKSVKNHVIRMKDVPNIEELNKISAVINQYMKHNCINEMKYNIKEDNNEFSKENLELIKLVLKTVSETFKQENNVQLYTSGVKNILAFPEFSDLEKAKIIFQTLEEKDMLITLLDQRNNEYNDSIQILIGDENNLEQMKDCSIIKTEYKLGDDSFGSIGIIGPTRMNYAQVVSVLNGIVKNINDVIKVLSGG